MLKLKDKSWWFVVILAVLVYVLINFKRLYLIVSNE